MRSIPSENSKVAAVVGDGGYTLAELMVVMLIFSIVMGLLAVSFSRIVTNSGHLIKAVETDIGGLIGLEVFRSDLELAGFGLPYSVEGAPDYEETTKQSAMVAGCPGTAPNLYNDPPDDPPLHSQPDPPRAYVSGNNVGYNGSDYLVLKGSPLAMSPTCRSWSYLNYSPGSAVMKTSKSEVELTPDRHERVVVLRNSVSPTGVFTKQLVTEVQDDGKKIFTLVFDTPLSRFKPRNENEVHLMYGIAPQKPGDAPDPANPELLFPFNRADYYIERTSGISPSCAKDTGTLYKAVMSQNSPGYYSVYPLLDCVADMQAFFIMDTNGDGDMDRWVSDFSEVKEGGLDASEIRAQLKEVRIYILAQQGKEERGYRYPLEALPIVVGDPELDGQIGRRLGSVWSQASMTALDPNWRHYRWKVYRIVLQPKNL